MKTQLLLLCTICLVVFSCKESDSKNQNTSTSSTEKVSTKYTLTPFDQSFEYNDASLKEVSYKDGKFDFTLGESSYELAAQTPDAGDKMCANSGKGQHIHLIIDDAPYAAKYSSSFEHKVADGEHYMLAFLSRSYHESIKTSEANLTKKVMIKDSSIIDMKDVDNKMLFYSRPKGTYVGKDTKKVMLDFYLNNLVLSEDGYKVEAKINGEKHLINNWVPYYIAGLPIGENTIVLTLLDSDGSVVDTPLNPVSRKFNLKEDPTTEM